MKKHHLQISLISIMISFLSGCAPLAMNATVNEKTVIAKTADYFGAPPNELSISNINNNVINTSYRTVYKDQMYNCTIYYGAVECKKPGG